MSDPFSVPLAFVAVLAFVSVWVVAYNIWARERTARNNIQVELAAFKEARRIEILFDDQDDIFVRPTRSRFGTVSGEFYWVGLYNAGKQTLHDVTLRAQEGWFVQNTIAIAHQEPIIVALDALHPGATEMIQMFGRDYRIGSADDVFRNIRRFALEARALDTATIVSEFEYAPDRRPMIRKISSYPQRVAQVAHARVRKCGVGPPSNPT